LASGEHTLVVRAIDSEGRVEANTETQSFQVDPVFTVFMPMIQR